MAKRGQPRDGNGKFVRPLEAIERAKTAERLVTQGMTYEEAARRAGFPDRITCWRAVRQIRAEAVTMDGGAEDLRQAELRSLQEQRRLLWEQILSPPPAISRTGKIVTDASGQPVPDAAAVNNAHAILVRVGQRIGAIRGYDAPRKSLSLSGHAGPEELLQIFISTQPGDLSAAIELYRRHVDEEAAKYALPGAIED